MNTRQLGRMLELREAKVWESHGWTVQVAWREARYIGKGKFVASPKDFFELYDLIAIHKTQGNIALIQVTNHPSKREPMDIWCPLLVEDLEDQFVDDLIEDASSFSAGIYEIYVYYRKLKSKRGWQADRRWWTKEDG